MKRVLKGDFGYIKFRRKFEIIKTLFMLALSIAMYEIGLITTGTNSNMLTYVAVLGCLPMAKFAIGAIMFIKAKGCSPELKEYFDKRGVTPWYYDLWFTSYDKNFQISALYYKKKNLLMITEDENLNAAECEEHIKNLLKTAGFDNLTVKVFIDRNKFADRVLELKDLLEDEKQLEFLQDNIINVSL